MSEPGFFDVALGQRACRRFDPSTPVPDVDVERILSAAVRAPSAENTQPWTFVVIRDDATRAELDAIWAAAWTMGSEHLDPTGSDADGLDLPRAPRQVARPVAPTSVGRSGSPRTLRTALVTWNEEKS